LAKTVQPYPTTSGAQYAPASAGNNLEKRGRDGPDQGGFTTAMQRPTNFFAL
jgi:hypothetical protein